MSGLYSRHPQSNPSGAALFTPGDRQDRNFVKSKAAQIWIKYVFHFPGVSDELSVIPFFKKLKSYRFYRQRSSLDFSRLFKRL